MTTASDGLPGSASDRVTSYEQLRTRVLEEHRVSKAGISAMVLVGQGMSAWLQLDARQEIEAHGRGGDARPRAGLAGARHSELLAVLTSLVFNICKRKESA